MKVIRKYILPEMLGSIFPDFHGWVTILDLSLLNEKLQTGLGHSTLWLDLTWEAESLDLPSAVPKFREIEIVANSAWQGQSKDPDATLLHWAAYCNTTWPISKFLKDKHVDVLARDTSGRTAYEVAIEYGRTKAIKFFEDHFKNTDTLLFAAKWNQWAFFNFLITAYQHDIANKRDGRGNTVLLYAAKNDKLETVRWLLEQGSSLCEQNNAGADIKKFLSAKLYKQLLVDFAIGSDLTLPDLKGIDVSGCIFIGTVVSYTWWLGYGWSRTLNASAKGTIFKYCPFTRDILKEMGATNWQDAITTPQEWIQALREGKADPHIVGRQLAQLEQLESHILSKNPRYVYFQSLEKLDEFLFLLQDIRETYRESLLNAYPKPSSSQTPLTATEQILYWKKVIQFIQKNNYTELNQLLIDIPNINLEQDPAFPLLFFACQHSSGCWPLLASLRINSSWKDTDGNTILHKLAQYKNTASYLSLLLNEHRDYRLLAKEYNTHDESCLHMLAKLSWEESERPVLEKIFIALRKSGIVASHHNHPDHETVLHTAIRYHQPIFIQVFVQAFELVNPFNAKLDHTKQVFTQPDLSRLKKYQENLIKTAVRFYDKKTFDALEKSLPIAMYMQESGSVTVDIDALGLQSIDAQGFSPIHWATLSPDAMEIITRLYYLGAALDSVDAKGNTALHLLTHKYLKNQSVIDASTALRIKQFNADLEAIRYLLSVLSTSSISLQNHENQNPLDMALHARNILLTNLLKEQTLYVIPLERLPIHRRLVSLPFIRNLIFQGGGPKGIAYVGALEKLAQYGIPIESIENVGGTSAGAITALLVAVGYSSDEVKTLLGNLSLADFLDHETRRTTIFSLKDGDALQQFWAGLTGGVALLNALRDGKGLFPGKTLHQWLAERVADKLASFYGGDCERAKLVTFMDLRDLKERGYPVKNLAVIGSDISTEPPSPVEFSARNKMTQDTPIVDAVRISLSIPGLFEPFKYNGHYYVDGGVFDNYPIELFDYVEFLPENHPHKQGTPNRKIENEETLGFRLIENQELLKAYQQGKPLPEKLSSEEKSWNALWNELAMPMKNAINFSAQQESTYASESTRKRTVYIETMGVSLFDFNLTRDKQFALMRAGQEGVEQYFCRAQFSKGGLRFTTVRLIELLEKLIPHIVAATDMSYSPELRFLPNKQREMYLNISLNAAQSPEVVCQLLECANREETENLFTLGLNLYVRNEKGQTAFHLAIEQGDFDLLQKLIQTKRPEQLNLNVLDKQKNSLLDVAYHLPKDTVEQIKTRHKFMLGLLELGIFWCQNPQVVTEELDGVLQQAMISPLPTNFDRYRPLIEILRTTKVELQKTAATPFHQPQGVSQFSENIQSEALAKLGVFANPAPTSVMLSLGGKRQEFPVLSLENLSYWYDDQDIDCLLKKQLVDHQEAYIASVCYPFQTLLGENSIQPAKIFQDVIMDALGRTIVTVLPISNLEKHELDPNGLAGNAVLGSHWIGMVILPNPKAPNNPTLLYLDPFGHPDNQDYTIFSTTTFNLLQPSPFTQDREAHWKRIYRLVRLLHGIKLDVKLVVSGLQQQTDEVSCGPLCVHNLVTVVKENLRTLSVIPDPGLLRIEHLRLRHPTNALKNVV